MEILLLATIVVLSIMMIPFGLPGTWLIAAAAFGYKLLVPAGGLGYPTVIGVTILAIVSAIIETYMAASYTRKYGGSRRAAWGAILGGIVGAFMGIPIPIVGSVIGAFAGAFVGAMILEMTAGTSGAGATRVATGALLGRVVGAVLNVAIGIVMGFWVIMAAF